MIRLEKGKKMSKTLIYNSVIKKLIVLILIVVFSTLIIFPKNVKAESKEPIGGNYFHPDFESKEEAAREANKVNEEIFSEGVIMLKNEDNSLPIAVGSKISLFGKNALNILKIGSGSTSSSGNKNITIEGSLTAAGYKLNPALINFYRNNSLSGSGRGAAPVMRNVPSGYNTGETPINKYTNEIEESYSEYNDVAIVVFQRISGEGFDLPRTMMWNGSSYREWSTKEAVPGARAKDDHYLQLDQNEADLLKYVGSYFDNVVVLLNTGSQFEVGFLDDPNHYGYHENIKAALWVGYPGGSGLSELGKILNGTINPSGKTTDTYARDFKKDPTWENFGNNLEDYGNQYSNLPSTGGHGGGYRNNYVHYEEGIYVGYRYYETRGFTDGEAWYKEHVVYPFGHGLSYTSFTQEIVSSSPEKNSTLGADDQIRVTVKVTNTGSVAGKEIVQLYYTAPYYNKGIEKAHVVLGAFEKTQLLAPGESEEVTLELTAREMASYDYNDANNNGFRGYELEHGTYVIRIMRDAHNEIEAFEYHVNDDVQYEYDEVTGFKVENRFDDVSFEMNEYLSRSDWEGTYPKMKIKMIAKQAIIDGSNLWFGGNNPADEGQPYYSNTFPVTGDDTGDIQLKDLFELDYDDPLWDDFLDQLSVETMKRLVSKGYYRSGVDIPELGIKDVINADSPAGWTNWGYGTEGSVYTLYTGETVLAATWNKELAYKKGIMIGNEALFGNGGEKSRFPGWYAPAVNLHRSAFGGRNFEYYSEDGYLSGKLAAQVIKGATEKGVFTYLKHFALNEQETYRQGTLTWANEQSMRELYFKPFEIGVKEGKTKAIMSSFNRLGTTWTGGNYELLTNVLRNEWGFRGMVVTDTFISGMSNADQMIRAGGDLALGNTSITYKQNSATTVSVLRNAAHNFLYTHANSMVINDGYSSMPKPLSSYKGAVLSLGTLNISYYADIATVKVNKDVLGSDVEDEMIEYRLKEDSTLPAGLNLNLDGTISGYPEEEVTNFNFTVIAGYQEFFREATFTISITNPFGSIIYQLENDNVVTQIGENITLDFGSAYIYKPNKEETEQLPTITYSLKSGSLNLAGLSFSETGVLTGLPRRAAKNYQLIIVASAEGYKDAEAVFNLSVLDALKFEARKLKAGKFGERYLDQVNPASGSENVEYELKEGNTLPVGLTLSKATGYIVGTPIEVVNDHQFIVVANSEFSDPIEAVYTISIGISYRELNLPHAKVDKNYDVMINTAQGARDITYELKEGSVLPEGLTISSEGILAGKPVKEGLYKFSVIAKSQEAIADEAQLSIFVGKDLEKKNILPLVISLTSAVVAAVAGRGVYLILRKRK